IAGVRADKASYGEAIWGDETNGPDIGPHAFYGVAQAPPNGTTPNSIAAGAVAAGRYAPVDNHKAEGGNVIRADGSGSWYQDSWYSGTALPRAPRYAID